MIVSHQHRFIYIKTKKTASSSIEAALSTVCGPDDIITPTTEEVTDAFEGERNAQNFRLDHPLVPKRPLIKRLLRRPERYYHPSIGYYEHMPAWRVKAYLGDKTWNSYFKFTFERNPWDRQVSWYKYKTRKLDRKPSFGDFMANTRRAFVNNYELYSIGGEVVLDHVGRYESLASEFEAAMEKLGLAGRVKLPVLNTTAKPAAAGAAPYRGFYDERLRDTVADWYGREIKAFGYEY
jgi:hypothetical protein